MILIFTADTKSIVTCLSRLFALNEKVFTPEIDIYCQFIDVKESQGFYAFFLTQLLSKETDSV